MNLNDEDKRRYARHVTLSTIGEAGQAAIQAASVLVIGAGGIGSACLSYLAAAGIGRLGIIDGDHVELSNLQRQIIHEEGDIGRLKVESAADRISELNSHVAVEIHPRRITEQNASAIIGRYDIVADGCDNFATRLLVNHMAYQSGKQLISASAIGFAGQLLWVNPQAQSACLQCLMPEAPAEGDSCRDRGVAGPLCGMMGSLQALEIIKWLAGASPLKDGIWLRYDGLSQSLTQSRFSKNPDCPVCASSQQA